MTLAWLSGAAAGLGVYLILVGLWPAQPTVAASLRRVDAAGRPRVAAGPVTAPDGRFGQLQVQVAGWLTRRGLQPAELTGHLRADLAVTGRSPELLLGAKVSSALLGLLTPLALTAALSAAGLSLPVLIPLWISLTAAAVAFLLPDLRLRRAAATHRRAFRAAVGGFLDLVAMRMASGAGLAEALHDAAAVGTGSAFSAIRGALADARTDGLTPAQALGRLGEQLHLPDLVDAATRLRLVDASGAQAQVSLRAQAASLRDRELSDAQGRAGEQAQSMLVAQVVLALGFVLFLGYPAVAKVLAT